MTRDRESGANPFQDIDGKLTIYALANGMDLAKAPGSRRLSWYADGRERGVLLGAPEDDVWTLQVGLWKPGTDAPLLTEELTRVAGTQTLLDELPALMETARTRADAL